MKMSHALLAAALPLLGGAGCASAETADLNRGVTVALTGIDTFKVYESEEKPGHNAWPAVFQDSDGGLCVVFQQVTGDLKRKSDYSFLNPGKEFVIKLIGMRMAKGETRFRKIWEKTMMKPHSFVIPAPTPSRDGRMIAICRPTASPDFAGLPEESAVIAESADYGKTLTVRSVIHAPGIQLVPNDIRYIGDSLFAATYDGKGGAHLFESKDDGRTWSAPFEIVRMHDNMSFHEPTFTQLGDGSLAVFLRTHRMDIPKHNGINYHKTVLSRTPEGSWRATPVEDTGFGFRGRPYVLRSSGGVLILACPGQFLAFSRNDGRTWESGLWEFGIPEVTIVDAEGVKPFRWNAETTVHELPDGRFYYSWFLGSDYPFPPPCDEYIGGSFFRIDMVK